MDLEEARATLFATLSSVSHTESIPLAEALGRVTAEPVYAQLSLPPFPASAMDGYAVRREDFGQKKTTAPYWSKSRRASISRPFGYR